MDWKQMLLQRMIFGGGGGSGSSHDKGWFATQAALLLAWPVGADGDYAIVGATDSVWVWDSDTTAWKNSGIVPSAFWADDGFYLYPIDNRGVMTDAIVEKTLNAGVTIDGLLIKDGKIPSMVYPSTSKYFVDGELGVDATATGNWDKPYKTIQACLDAIGQPRNTQDFKKHIEIHISDKLSAPLSGTGWNAIYTENLVFPHRCITVYGKGVKIDGTITREISEGREWVTPSADFRGCITFMGLLNTRDSHNRLRNGFHIGGTFRTKVIQRSISQIVGDGVNKVTVDVATPYQIDVGIKVFISSTTNYNTRYTITAKNSETQFVATRDSGTNPSVAVELTGGFFECDTAGASGTTNDIAFYNTYCQGQVSVDDGVNNGGAPTAGATVLYMENCRTNGGIDGTGITVQRIINNEFTGAINVASFVSVERNVFNAAISTATFTNASNDMHWLNNQFGAAIAFTVRSAGQTVYMDSTTYSDFVRAGCTWVTNTPTILRLNTGVGIANDSSVSGATVKDALNTLLGLSAAGCVQRAFMSIPYTSSGVVNIGSALPANSIATKVQAHVETEFNGTSPTLKIGDTDLDNRFVAIGDLDLTALDELLVVPVQKKYTSSKQMIATIVPGAGGTKGVVDIIIEYILF